MAKNTKKTAKKTTAKKPAGKKPATKKPTKPATKKPAQKKPSAKKPTTKKTTKTTPKKPTSKRTTKATPKKKTSGAKKTNGRGKKVEKRDEFRTHKINGHPSYIYEKVGNRYKYLGVTHSKITQGTKNIELDQNPNPKDDQKAYVRPAPKQDKVKKFKNSPLKNWKMGESDKKKIKPLTK